MFCSSLHKPQLISIVSARQQQLRKLCLMWSSEMVARMLSIALALVSMAGAGAIQYPQEWHLWKSEHGVTYTVREMHESQCTSLLMMFSTG